MTPLETLAWRLVNELRSAALVVSGGQYERRKTNPQGAANVELMLKRWSALNHDALALLPDNENGATELGIL